MIGAAFAAVIGLPLCGALALLVPGLRASARRAAPWMAVPALLLASVADQTVAVDLPWLLLGSRLTLDAVGRLFLLFSAVIWLVSGLYGLRQHPADPAHTRFAGFFLVSMAGNVGTILAGDAITFYFFFSVMSLAAYVLVVHDGRRRSRRAGRVYITFVVIGELLLFVGIVGMASLQGHVGFPSTAEPWMRTGTGVFMLVCVFLGFASKMGTVPLHMSLPLAYQAAPTAAGAALGGPMIKAGLLGWIRLLPLGEAAVPALGIACIALGFVSAFWGVMAGVAQRHPRALLGYSSISQMGLITAGIGVALLVPESWSVMLPAVAVFALHHALAKSALFLGLGFITDSAARSVRLQPDHARSVRLQGRARSVRLQPDPHLWILATVALPALVLAGVPFSSGAAAKLALKKGAEAASIALPVFDPLLSLASIGTTVLMARFVMLVWRRRNLAAAHPGRIPPVPSLALVAASTLAVLALPWLGLADAARDAVSLEYVWSTLWPAATGFVLAWTVWRRPGLLGPLVTVRVPAGDLVHPVRRAVRCARRALEASLPADATVAAPASTEGRLSRAAAHLAERGEHAFRQWEVVAPLLLAFAAVLLATLAF